MGTAPPAALAQAKRENEISNQPQPVRDSFSSLKSALKAGGVGLLAQRQAKGNWLHQGRVRLGIRKNEW